MGEERPSLRQKLARYSWLSGAACLIPVPLLDDWALRLVRRKMARDLLRDGTLLAAPEQAAILAEGDSSSWTGCAAVVGLPIKLFFAILAKIFRKIFFLLAIKQASDESIRTMLHGFLLDDVIQTGVLDQAVLSENANHVLGRIYWAIDAALREVDPRPFRTTVRKLFRSERRELSRTSNELAAEARQQRRSHGNEAAEPLDALPESSQESVADQLGSVFWSNPDYLDRLRTRFRVRLRSDVPLPKE